MGIIVLWVEGDWGSVGSALPTLETDFSESENPSNGAKKPLAEKTGVIGNNQIAHAYSTEE